MGLKQRITKMEEKLKQLEELNYMAAKLSAKNDEIIRELISRVKALEKKNDQEETDDGK